MRHLGPSSVGYLCLGNDHERPRIAVQSAVTDVADDTESPAARFLELGPYVLADDDLLADGILLGPELLGHGFIENNDIR